MSIVNDENLNKIEADETSVIEQPQSSPIKTTEETTRGNLETDD